MSIEIPPSTKTGFRIPRTIRALPFTPERIVGEMPPPDYHAFLRKANEKFEYVDGKVVRMSGATLEHNRIAFDFGFTLSAALEEADSPCEVVGSDQKIYVAPRFIYLPDISIICGKAEIDSEDCLRNPTAIVEVLSPSTAPFDMGDKFRDYRTIPSLQHYILVAQDAPAVTHYERLENGFWSIVGDYTSLDDVLLLTLNAATISVPLTRIYRRVTFTEAISDDASDPT